MSNAILEVEKLSKVFPGPFYALKEVSFAVEKGDILGVIGLSGAGKSTLTRCLTHLETPTSGRIWFQDEELTSATEKNLRRLRASLGMIFQHFNLFSSRNVLDNILFPLEIAGVALEERLKRAQELISLVGLCGKERHFPSQLSGGEKQRVAIGRALATNPTLLFSDEATSSLDPTTTRLILDLLLSLNKKLGLTIVLITHQMEVIKQICNKMCVLDKGQIVESGLVSDIFARPTHPVTASLVHPPQFRGTSAHALYQLTFQGKAAAEPLISRMIRSFDVEVNILFGSIEKLREGPLGRLTVELAGPQLAEAIAFLQSNGVLLLKEDS